jgi:hypothetical protein
MKFYRGEPMRATDIAAHYESFLCKVLSSSLSYKLESMNTLR